MSDAVSGGGVGGDGGVFILFFLGYPKLVSPEKRKSCSFVRRRRIKVGADLVGSSLRIKGFSVFVVALLRFS